MAIVGATAVAAAVSAGIDGLGVRGAIQRAITSTLIYRGFPPPTAYDDVSARIKRAARRVRGRTLEEAADYLIARIGTSLATIESVPAAFGVLSAVPDDPWQACLLAASLGGDSDTIAAMAGAMAGACHGMSAFPGHAIATVDAHGLGLTELADALYALRARMMN